MAAKPATTQTQPTINYPLHLKDASKIVNELREKLAAAYAEISVLSSNNNGVKQNLATLQKNEQYHKERIVDLQTRLLASQDRVTELQDQLLAMRAAAESEHIRKQNG